jgi:hypothetical protein
VSLKVVFLDFDGVLNSKEFFRSPRHEESEAGALDPEAIARLNRLLAATGAVVVISSSWRHGYPVEALASMLESRGFVGVVHDKTRDWISPACTQRGDEIADWLRDHPECTTYVVLDDGADMDAVRERFVQTDVDDGGLQDTHVDRAIAMLGGETP